MSIYGGNVEYTTFIAEIRILCGPQFNANFAHTQREPKEIIHSIVPSLYHTSPEMPVMWRCLLIPRTPSFSSRMLCTVKRWHWVYTDRPEHVSCLFPANKVLSAVKCILLAKPETLLFLTLATEARKPPS